MIRSDIFVCGIVFLMCSLPLFLYSQEDCRLNLSQIQPVVDPQSATVLDYEWDPTQRMEIMLMDSARIAIITQDGCMRHRTRFQLELFHPLISPTDADWMALLRSFILPMFEHDNSFQTLWEPFLEEFEQNLYVHGTNRQFDISLGSQDFICFVQEIPNQNTAIFIEQIGFLFKEKIRKVE